MSADAEELFGLLLSRLERANAGDLSVESLGSLWASHPSPFLSPVSLASGLDALDVSTIDDLLQLLHRTALRSSLMALAVFLTRPESAAPS